jgi:pyrroloquinoline quinone biosynthesis protein B
VRFQGPVPAAVHVILLGTAAGGGFPQWNCWCPPCRVARTTPARAYPRSQSSIAVSADGVRWFLCNASPDVRDQLRWLTARHPAPETMRLVPIEAVILTDAELDHTLGIVLLREARQLRVYATAGVEAVLDADSRVLPTTRAFADVDLVRLPLDEAIPLVDRHGQPAGLTIEAFAVPGDPPRFASVDAPDQTIGLLIHDPATGGTLAFVPGSRELDDAVRARLARATLILYDGTCWTDDELRTLGISSFTTRQMGHQPMDGPGGSLAALRDLTHARRVYTHINNSNPVLIEDSPERHAVVAAGLLVGADGAEFVV